MTTIDPDGFCTRCQEPANSCKCPPLPVDAALGIGRNFGHSRGPGVRK